MAIMIKIERRGDRFYARYPFSAEINAALKALHFRFDPNVQPKGWWTDRADIAMTVEGNSEALVARINAQKAEQHAKDAASIEASRATDANIAIPAPEGLRYLPYQKAGIAFAMGRKATLIADEMGLGKSIEALGVINADPSIRSALVICPASLKLNWQRESVKWLTRSFAVIIASSKPTTKISETLVSALALNHQIGADSGQESDLIRNPAQRPEELRLGALDSSLSGNGAAATQTSEASEKRNHASISIRESDSPRPVSQTRSIAANPTFTVDDSGHVRQNDGIVWDSENRGEEPQRAKPLPGQSAEMITDGSIANPKLTNNVRNLRALLDSLESEPQLSIAYSAGPCQGILLILNYEILSAWRNIIDAVDLSIGIIDEVHYLKNYKAKRTRAILGHWDRDPAKVVEPIKAGRRLFMTGTPITNRPAELWPLVQALDPQGLGKSWHNFHTRYCAAFKGDYGWDTSGASHLDELQAKMRAGFMVRRKKAEVLTELPPKNRQIIALRPETDAAKTALAREKAAVEASEVRLFELRVAVELSKASENPQDYEDAVAKLTDASQAAFTEIARLRREVAEAKVPDVVEHVINVLRGTDKVVVMAHHKEVISQLMAALVDYRPVRLTGEMALDDRQMSVDAFQTDPAVRVFIGSIRAAGVGITLTAASHVVFAELDWTPAALSQAEDRCHRIGQRDSVLVQHIVLDGSLDARMAGLLVEKQAVADAALDNGEKLPAAEVLATPVEPVREPAVTKEVTQKQVAEEAPTVSAEVVKAVHAALRALAGVCDGAVELDGHGFNRFDTVIGKRLAMLPSLTAKQAVLGKKIIWKYHRQLPAELLEIAKRKE